MYNIRRTDAASVADAILKYICFFKTFRVCVAHHRMGIGAVGKMMGEVLFCC